MENYVIPRHPVFSRFLKQLWHNRLMAVVFVTSLSLLVGFTVVRALPRGPATATQTLFLMLSCFLLGISAGVVMRSPWAILTTTVPYILAIEIGQLGTVGSTVGPIRLDEAFGILALLLGRGFHTLVAVLPIIAGVGIGLITT